MKKLRVFDINATGVLKIFNEKKENIPKNLIQIIQRYRNAKFTFLDYIVKVVWKWTMNKKVGGNA